jgi:hypothetical protein
MELPLWKKHVLCLPLYWLFWPYIIIAKEVLHIFSMAVLAFLAIFSTALAITILCNEFNISGRKPKKCERKPKEREKCETYLIDIHGNEIPWHMSSLATEDN